MHVGFRFCSCVLGLDPVPEGTRWCVPCCGRHFTSGRGPQASGHGDQLQLGHQRLREMRPLAGGPPFDGPAEAPRPRSSSVGAAVPLGVGSFLVGLVVGLPFSLQQLLAGDLRTAQSWSGSPMIWSNQVSSRLTSYGDLSRARGKGSMKPWLGAAWIHLPSNSRKQ